MEIIPASYDLSRHTMKEFASLLEGDLPVVVMVPVGAVEPHGPHLGLGTDEVISLGAAIRAAAILEDEGIAPLIAPSVPYGVTECAAAFKGAVSVSPDALTGYLHDIISSLIDDGVEHVCLVNNHLEPEQIAAVKKAKNTFGPDRVSVACPVAKQWARTLSKEFKSGACHAGEYETSIVMEFAPGFVREEVRQKLPGVPVSLSECLGRGVTDFIEMGLAEAYSGDPSQANARHGRDQLEKLATMIATEILEAIGRGRSPSTS